MTVFHWVILTRVSALQVIGWLDFGRVSLLYRALPPEFPGSDQLVQVPLKPTAEFVSSYVPAPTPTRSEERRVGKERKLPPAAAFLVQETLTLTLCVPAAVL